jgi:hypothetical protein
MGMRVVAKRAPLIHRSIHNFGGWFRHQKGGDEGKPFRDFTRSNAAWALMCAAGRPSFAAFICEALGSQELDGPGLGKEGDGDHGLEWWL